MSNKFTTVKHFISYSRHPKKLKLKLVKGNTTHSINSHLNRTTQLIQSLTFHLNFLLINSQNCTDFTHNDLENGPSSLKLT